MGTDVSEETAASIFMIEEKTKHKTSQSNNIFGPNTPIK
jgi:hypothetical protein